jgi:HemY protein
VRGLLWLLAAFALAVALSLAMRANDGYAMFVLHPWRVEISLKLLAILLLAAFVAGYLIVGVVLHMVRLPSHVRAFRARRHETQGRGAVFGAIQALFEGRFGRAEKLAARACDLGVAPALASLIAARAAQRMRDFERRDQWLERAKAYDSDWRLARQVVMAELLLEERRFDEARTVLRELHASGPKHIATLTLLLRAEQGLGNWSEVIRLAKLLEGRGAMPAEAIEGIRVNASIALLSRKTYDPADLARRWREIPESGRTHPKVAAAAARAFMQLGDCRTAHRLIGEALEREWSGELVLLYGECTNDDALDRIERAERWLHERPDDAELQLTLGRLCVQRELWGKAQNYLEASLTAQPTPAVHVALANLFDRIGRTEDANRHYRASADAGVAPQAGR